MKIGSTILLLFLLSNILGQNTFNYRLDFDRPVPSVLTSIEVTDSCYYACGITNDSIWPFRIGSLFSKISLEGEVLWHKTVTDSITTYENWRNTLTPTNDGNFIVTGLSYDTISITALMMKYTSNGDTIFTRRYRSPYYPTKPFISLITSLKTPDEGHLLLSNVSNPAGTADIYLIKTDSLGDIEWDEIYGGQIWSEGVNSVFYNGEGKYIIGAWQTNVNFVNNNYKARTYLFQIDSLGTIEWEYLSTEDELQNSARDILPTADGGYVIASGKGIEFISGPNSMLLWHPYIYKIDANRNFVWGVNIRDSFPSPDNYFSKMIAPSDESGIIAVGTIFEYTGGGGYNVNGIISKISNDGDSLWTRYYNHVDSPADTHAFYDVEETADGGFIMVGQATDHFAGGEQPLQRSWLVKLDQYGCLVPGCQIIDGVDEFQVDIKLDLYPNPTSDYLNVFYYDPYHSGAIHFRIVDVHGRVMKVFSSLDNNITHIVSLSNFIAGQYFLTVEYQGKTTTKSFVVK